MDKAREIADYMFRIGTERTMSGNYCFYYDELNELFGTDFPNNELARDVEIAMYENYNVLDGGAEDWESCFDWMFGLADCIGFRRDCTCKLCGKKIRQVNIGCIEQEEWGDELDEHIKEYHPDSFIGIKEPAKYDDSDEAWEYMRKHGGCFPICVQPAIYVSAQDYFEIGECY